MKGLSLIRRFSEVTLDPESRPLESPSLIPTLEGRFVNPTQEISEYLIAEGKVLLYIRTFRPPKVNPPDKSFFKVVLVTITSDLG